MADKRLIRAGDEFDSSDLDGPEMDFETAAPAPEPADEPAEPWAMTKPKTPRLLERFSKYMEHLRRSGDKP